LKAEVVSKDEFETTGLRAILNYGHTFAHAIEADTKYGQLLHGEAVSIGMHLAAQAAVRRGMIDASIVDRQSTLLQRLGLPIHFEASTTLGADAKRQKSRERKARFHPSNSNWSC
jgi:3-dehydroquinate synthase